MADTTVYTVSAGYIPYLAYGHTDFKVGRHTSGKRRQMADGGFKYDGTQLLGPESIKEDGTLRKPKIRGSIGWFEYSTKMREINTLINTDELLTSRLKEMAEEFYRRDLGDLSDELLQSFVSSGRLGDISPTGEHIDTGQRGTPEEMFNPDDFDVTRPAEMTGVGKARSIDMYVTQGGNIYRMDVTAMTFDTKAAHHGLSSFEDRLENGVTGKQLLDTIFREGGHGEGSQAQKDLWKYFKKQQDQHWNPLIRRLKERAYATGDSALKGQMDDLHAGKTTLHKLGENFKNSLTQIRGGSKAQVASADNPAVGASRQSFMTQSGNWDKRYKKYKRNIEHQIRIASVNSAIDASTYSASVEFVLHALGNMLEIASGHAGGGQQYGFSTGYGMGEGLAGNFVVEVMHRFNTKGQNVLLFKQLRSRDVVIHNEAQLTHAFRNQLMGVSREQNQAVHEQESIQQNSLAAGRIFSEDVSSIEIGAISTAGINQVAGQPRIDYAAVIAPSRANADIDRFINTLHGDPKKIRKMLGTKGKTINLTSKYKAYERIWNDKSPVTWGSANNRSTGLSEGSNVMFNLQNIGGGSAHALSYFDDSKNTDGGQNNVQRAAAMMGGKAAREGIRATMGFGVGSHNVDSMWAGAGMGGGVQIHSGLDQLSRASPTSGTSHFGAREYWGLEYRMGELMRQEWDETVVPDFWAAPYLTLLYPSSQVSVRGEKSL